MAIAQIPTDSELGKKIAAAFPECFTDGEDEGPVPLSYIVQKGWEKGDYDHYDEEAALDLNVPFVRWSTTDANYARYPDIMFGRLPDKFLSANDVSFGAKVTIDGNDYVVIYEGDDEIAVAPAERVFADTRSNDMANAA